jgi:hypothetical protein
MYIERYVTSMFISPVKNVCQYKQRNAIFGVSYGQIKAAIIAEKRGYDFSLQCWLPL